MSADRKPDIQAGAFSMTILGSGPMADSMRAQVAADPDRFRPETWSMDPVGECPCCGRHIHRATTRETGFVEGFMSHAKVVHPRMNPETGEPDPNGTVPGCCCSGDNWGPKHDEPAPKAKPRKRRSKR